MSPQYKGFTTLKSLPLHEIGCHLTELRHEKTGAHVLHLKADDPENLFCLSFRTYPDSSNGAAHILEHTVLCGSEKYPVKDPFFSMTRRSLHTFMNALTGADFTCYPASSQVEKDFYNLLEVYIDALFHPLLREESFLQEGHRLELADGKVVRKGVVYNEMKGALTSAESRLWHTMMKHLVPDLPYAYNSGGDPQDIVQLSYPELLQFYRRWIHPSRCLFFFYGDLPLQKHLDFIESKVLHSATLPTTKIPSLQRQPRFTEMKIVEDRYPVVPEETPSLQTYVSFGFLTTTLSDPLEVLALTLLECILLETDASPLRKALLKSGLCSEIETYLDDEMSEVPWIIICKGCAPDGAVALEKLLRSTLKKCAAKGFSQEQIEGALHQLEFERTEIGGGNPYGLTLFFRSGLPQQHGSAAEDGLMIHSLFQQLLQRVEKGYLSSLIETHLLNNPHCVRLTLHPDPGLQKEEERAEQQQLEQIERSLTEEAKAQLIAQAAKLSHYQDELQAQNIDCLPKIDMADIPKTIKDFPLTEYERNGWQIFHHDCFTNQILYADLIFDLPDIAVEDLTLLSLFSTLLTDLGCGSRNWSETQDYMQHYIGGIEASLGLFTHAEDPERHRPAFCLKGKALYRNSDKLLQLFQDLLLSPHYEDHSRIAELLSQQLTQLRSGLQKNALRYAVQLSTSGLSPSAHVSHQWQGLPYYKLLEKFGAHPKKELKALVDQLVHLRKRLFQFGNPQLILGCDQKHFEELERSSFFGLTQLPRATYASWKVDFTPPSLPTQGRIIASPVAFTVYSFLSVPYAHLDAPSLLVATQLMENIVLHAQIREKGGAYGCGASYLSASGIFYLYSFRDPHLASTIETFQSAIRRLAAGEFSEEDLDEAKLCVLQAIDAPVSPGQRAATAYFWQRCGKSPEVRQAYRDRILSLSKKEVQHAIEEHLLSRLDHAVMVSFAGKELLERELPSLPLYPI